MYLVKLWVLAQTTKNTLHFKETLAMLPLRTLRGRGQGAHGDLGRPQRRDRLGPGQVPGLQHAGPVPGVGLGIF